MCVSSNPPTRLLWDVISTQCSPAELIEVRRILGESLIEQSCELHAELQCLAEILQEASCSYDTRDHTVDKRVMQQVNDLLQLLRSSQTGAIESIAEHIRMELQLECDWLQEQIAGLQQAPSSSPRPFSSRRYTSLDTTRPFSSGPHTSLDTTQPLSSGRHTSLDRPVSGRLSSVKRFRQMIADNRTASTDNNDS